MKTQFILALSLAASAPAFASDDVNIKSVKLTGYECPGIDKAGIVLNRSDVSDTINKATIYYGRPLEDFTVTRPPEYKGTTSKTCYIEMDIEVPAGYTIGDINTNYLFYYKLGSSYPKLGIYSNLHSEGLNLWSPTKRSSRTIYGKRYTPVEETEEAQIEANFKDVGGLNHPDCHKDRTVKVKLDTRLFVTHRNSTSGWESFMGMQDITITLPTTNGMVGVPCGGSSGGGWNWGWWGW